MTAVITLLLLAAADVAVALLLWKFNSESDDVWFMSVIFYGLMVFPAILFPPAIPIAMLYGGFARVGRGFHRCAVASRRRSAVLQDAGLWVRGCVFHRGRRVGLAGGSWGLAACRGRARCGEIDAAEEVARVEGVGRACVFVGPGPKNGARREGF